MWIAFAIFFVLWALSIHLYLPVVLTFIFFALMITSAAAALTYPPASGQERISTHRLLD